MDSKPEKKTEPINDVNRVEEIDNLNTWAWELSNNDPIRSLELAERALQLSYYNDGSGQKYPKGVALALRTLAYIDTSRVDFPSALPRLLEALELFQTLDEPEAFLTVMNDLGWAYFDLGDFSRAVETLLKGLKFAREKQFPAQEVNILCSLGAVYGEYGDLQSSLEVLQRAVDFKKDKGINSKHGLALNNLAMCYLTMHDYDKAMDYAIRALENARQVGSEAIEVNSLDTVGQIALARKDYSLAENYIKEAIAINQRKGVNDEEMLLSLGRLYIEQDRLDEAANLLVDALESVEKKGMHRLGYIFHELLSKIYEARGDFYHALEHYRLFHESLFRIFNEDTQRKLENLTVLHNVETCRIDSEIYHLKNQALNREISAHRIDIAHMEALATTDALTGLCNRHHLLTLGGYYLEEAHKTGSPLTVLWMDIDNFKLVNDRHGHSAGDQVLKEVSHVIQASLRSPDLLSRFGGEEFVALLPGTPLTGAQLLAERILKNTAAHIVRVEDQAVQVTLSVGAARAAPSGEDLDTLLNKADQAQYAAKRAGKNRLVVDWACEPDPIQ